MQTKIVHVESLKQTKNVDSEFKIGCWPALLYKMPSNFKGKNFVSKFPGYCPLNTMAFFSSKLDGIKK